MRTLSFILPALLAISLVFPAYAASRQTYHSNPLCDDYVRLKLQEYVDGYETVTYDDYMAYKQQLVEFCDDAIRNNTPLPQQDRDALNSYNLSLD